MKLWRKLAIPCKAQECLLEGYPLLFRMPAATFLRITCAKKFLFCPVIKTEFIFWKKNGAGTSFANQDLSNRKLWAIFAFTNTAPDPQNQLTTLPGYLFVNGPDVLLKVGLLRVDLLADVAGGGGELHAAQVRQLDVLGQVAELLAAVRAERRFGPFAALASPPFSGQEGIGWLRRFFLQLVSISRRENDDMESKNNE
jgi:hypothetical protein